ncbi:MAG: ImmA/IrrE family metallo-endopeptidase [Methanobrevibacter sp.]|uniref:helix-turn-helix domain-containing protein n=1 Tax=Methanobrevibacter sp. TaxID=66852 RepID=UPI0025F4DF48|nr:XRE family transcriptional regulator [Methanobrevibacter sp.]MBR0271403.1 ImmA/IrrE family metallo-endopeptidase [Methanobrevibacter sp.]
MTSIGSRLRKLRVEYGYSQRQVAEFLEIDQSNLSKIENDKRNLNWTLSDKLISLYNCTPEYLLGETDEYEKININFKSGNDLDLKAIAKINRLTYHLNILRGLDDEKNKIKLPKLNINLRREFGLDEYCPINIFTLLVQKIPNLTIVSFPMKRSVSGCCYKKDIDSIILINSSHSIGRQNFTLAHELYHLLDDEKNFFICSEGLKDEIEIKADDFASNFLMTKHALYDFIERENISEWTIEDVIKCEQYFQIDHNSLIRRLYNEKFIDESQLAEFSFNIMDKAGKFGYDTSLYEPTHEDKKYYSIGHMIPLTEKIYEKGKISLGRRKDILLDLFRYDIAY